MSISTVNSTSLTDFYNSILKSKGTQSTSSTSVADLLNSVRKTSDTAFSSLMSDSSSSDSLNEDDTLFNLLSAPATNYSLLNTLQSSNAQSLQATLNGSSGSSARSIFDILSSSDDSANAGSGKAFDSSAALLRALNKSGMESSKVASIFKQAMAMSAESDSASSNAGTPIF